MINFSEVQNLFNNKKVALVGPADNLIGSKLGSFIDSFDIVCRINSSFIIPSQLEQDYGSRCDVLLSTCNLLLLCVLKRHVHFLKNTRFIVNPTSSVHDSDYRLSGKSVYENYLDYDIGIPFYQSEGMYEENMKKTGMNTGLCSISFLLNNLLNIKELYICGYSFYNLLEEKKKSNKMSSYKSYFFDINAYVCDCPPSALCQKRADKVSANPLTTVEAEEKQKMLFKRLTSDHKVKLHDSITSIL